MNTHYFLTISPAFFAVVGLLLFIGSQFLKNGFKLFCSIIGLLFVGFFIYKLLALEHESQLAYSYADRGNSAFHLSGASGFFSVIFLGIGINILGLIFWLSTMLRVTFGQLIPKRSQVIILLSGGLIFFLSLIIFKLFGNLVGTVCFPIMTIAYFISFNNFYKTLKAETANSQIR